MIRFLYYFSCFYFSCFVYAKEIDSSIVKPAFLQSELTHNDFLNDTGFDLKFGNKMAIDGNRAAISGEGRYIYLYEYQNDTWLQRSIINLNDLTNIQSLQYLALSGQRIVAKGSNFNGIHILNLSKNKYT